MSDPILFDAAGRRRSPATMPGHHRGRSPRNKGRHYPADPPTTEEIIAVMRCAGAAPYGLRARALLVLLWRAGLRVSEALPLAESDLDRSTGGVLVRLGKGGKRRRVGMDRWGRQQLQAASAAGFTELRLFVAAGQARARRFYEREGWVPIDDPFDDPTWGLTFMEIRYRLPDR